MSVNTLEAILYDISTIRDARQRFKGDPGAFLQRYAVSEEERSLVEACDVREMGALGVNPMLTMGFWMVMKGPQSLPEYLQAMAGSVKGG